MVMACWCGTIFFIDTVNLVEAGTDKPVLYSVFSPLRVGRALKAVTGKAVCCFRNAVAISQRDPDVKQSQRVTEWS